jgi:hypothetical protein
MKRTILVFGSIAGAIMSVLMLANMSLSDQIGFDRGLIIGYSAIVAAFLLVFFGIRSYRDNVAGGTISFGRAFLLGLGIVLIGSLCYTATWEVAYPRYFSDFGDRYTQYTLDNARKAGKSDAEILKIQEETKKMWESYKNPLVRMGYTFLEPAPVGLIIALVSAAVLRRKRRTDSMMTSAATS